MRWSFRKSMPFLLVTWGMSHASLAQTFPISGEYHLQGIMETASALLIKRDSTFELYFSYGAIERKGAGKWSLKNGQLTLNSRPRPAADFELTEEKTTNDTLTTIRITTQNQQLFPFFEITLRSVNGDVEGKTDKQGVFRTTKLPLSDIELFFSLCPERFSTFPIRTIHNNYTFRVMPWIGEIFLENVVLAVNAAGLKGQHPLLKGDQFEYSRTR